MQQRKERPSASQCPQRSAVGREAEGGVPHLVLILQLAREHLPLRSHCGSGKIQRDVLGMNSSSFPTISCVADRSGDDVSIFRGGHFGGASSRVARRSACRSEASRYAWTNSACTVNPYSSKVPPSAAALLGKSSSPDMIGRIPNRRGLRVWSLPPRGGDASKSVRGRYNI